MGFTRRHDLQMYFLGVEHEEKKSNAFSSSFGEEALLLDGFPRDIDSRNQAINSSRLGKKSDPQTPPFIVISERHDKQINKQTDIKGPWNLQDTTYPFGDKFLLIISNEKRAQRWDRKD